MQQWLRRARGAIGVGVTWAIVWAPVAIVLGTTVIDPDNSMDEMWFMVGAIPGFLSGVVFSVVLGIAARRRTLKDLSVARVGGWGALAGLVIGLLPFLLGSSEGSSISAWQLAAVVIPSFVVLSALSAAGSLAIAQRAMKQEVHGSVDDLADFGLSDVEVKQLLDGEARPRAIRPAARDGIDAALKR